MEHIKLNECDTKQLLQQILKRPGMYVGAERLDYIYIYLLGWMSGRYEKNKWHSNYDLQEWLFKNYSIAISHNISINGWSEFYAYFGVEKKAIDHFREFIEECPFTSYEEDKKWIAEIIYDIYSYHQYGEQIIEGFSNEEIADLKFPCDIETASKETVRLINDMIDEQYEELYVYICMGGAIQQIRFLYYTDQKQWRDNICLLVKEESIKQHIILHSYITMMHSSLFEDEHTKEIIITLKVIQNKIEITRREENYIWTKAYENYRGLLEEYFIKWRDEVLNTHTNIGEETDN